MRWFRAQTQWISLLAFTSLAFQLALSFGHVHLDPAHSRSGVALLAQRWTVPAAAAVPDQPDAPAQAIRLGDEFCAICSVPHQVASAVPPVGPPLPVLALTGGDPLDAAIDGGSAASSHASYRARASPVV